VAEIQVHQFENGLTLLGEAMPWLESAAFSISVPAGGRYDPADRPGLSNLVCEMVERGCGQRDSRTYIEDLEYLGVDSHSSASNSHIAFAGAMPADNLLPALQIYSDVLRRPQLPASQVEDAKKVCYQEILSLEDDLAQQVMLELRRLHYPDPLGRSSLGTLEGVQLMTIDDVQRHFDQWFRPQGTILGVAGRLDWQRLVECIENTLGDWTAEEVAEPTTSPAPGGLSYLPHDSQQTHIGVSFPTVPYRHPDYYKARGAVGVLSDGMSSRLFSEIREKRGLCYTVYASLHSLLDQACVVSYAGTSAERAQETLDVLLQELLKLRDGICEDELDRLKVQIRSSLVMQQESSRSRASAIAGDWYHLKTTRSLGEIQQKIDELSVNSINTFLESHAPSSFDVVTLGPEALKVAYEI
jgi:predicted Zn-dependent peptidase